MRGMIIGLITPCDIGLRANPGSHLLTAGIRWLIRQAVPVAAFCNLSMLEEHDEDWAAARCCDAVVLCGNPRFSLSTGIAFWENAIWDRLLALHEQGVAVIDAWAGSAFPFNELNPSVDEMAQAIAAFPQRALRLQQARALPHHITRDATMQRIYEAAGVPSVMLPCSSYWAAHELAVAPAPKAWDAIVLYRMPGYAELPGAILAAADRMRAAGRVVRIIAPTWPDQQWAHAGGVDDAELVNDAASLLRVLAGAARVLSFRLHAAIPAASLGAAASLVAVDSRAMSAELFDLPVIPFTAPERFGAEFREVAEVPAEPIIEHLRRMLC